MEFNKHKLQLLCYLFFHLEVGDSKLQKVRILIADKGAESLNGRDWLNAFNYKFVSSNENEGNQTINIVKSKTERLSDKNNQNEKKLKCKNNSKNSLTDKDKSAVIK